MAYDTKEIFELILPNNSENIEDFSDIADYIKKLGSQSLEHLQKEPAILAEEMKHLTEQTQELAFTNYKTFVETADISRTIMNDFNISKKSLECFLQTVPNFIEECENFSQFANNVVTEKSRYRNVRNQSDRLMEILELPALMREALNAEDYESALDLFTFVRNLSKKHSEVPIIQATMQEIMTLWFETLYHLFNQLRYDLPLPQCLQILGYLRRANTVYKSTSDDQYGGKYTIANKDYSNADGLHLHFLKARSAWFEHVLDDAKNTESPEKLLRRIVELHRIHLFNVLTQHKSIFLSDTQEGNMGDKELNGTSALSCWLKQKVAVLADILNENLQNEDESTFESLFNQCMYLCLSFGRVGADMRCILTPLFRKNLLKYFNSSLEKVDVHFETQMRSYKVSNMKNVPRPINENVAGPPESLLDYYPLAEYCNGILTVLNSLRVTAPLNVVKIVYKAFKSSYEKAVQVLVTYYHREQQAFSDIEKKNFISLCICFTDDFMPYIVKCLSQSFPSSLIAEQLGVTLTVLQESRILFIDQAEICKPLNTITGLLP